MQEKSMEQEVTLWNRVLRTTLEIPGVAVDRETFLRKELRIYYKADELNSIISGNSVIGRKYRERIAKGCIKYHLSRACQLSVLAGLPGGWWMLGTIPADISQYYAQTLILIQKMLYLYGWDDLRDGSGELSDEALNIITIWVGVMLGCSAAVDMVKKILAQVASQASKRIPQKAFGHAAWYIASKSVAKWIGISLTKKSTAQIASKAIPLLGGITSGALTYLTF
jgi:hypothetical protein